MKYIATISVNQQKKCLARHQRSKIQFKKERKTRV